MPTKFRNTVWSEPLPMRVSARFWSVTASRFFDWARSRAADSFHASYKLLPEGSCNVCAVSTSKGASEATAWPWKSAPDVASSTLI